MTIEAGASTPRYHRTLNPRQTQTGFEILATVPQRDTINRLVHDKRIPDPIAYGIKSYLDRGTLTKEQASEILDILLPFLNKPPENPAQELGIYVHPKTGAFYLLKMSQNNRHYAMDLVINDAGARNPDGTWKVRPRFEWVYQNGGAKAKTLQADWKATPEQMKEWGDIWGHCMKCHAELTVQKSIDQGMGDTCYKKQFGK